MAYKIKTKKHKLIDLELPIEQAVYVPTTNKYQKKITSQEKNKRVKAMEIFLSDKYGGFTAIKSEGGYIMRKNHGKPKIIEEDIIKVTTFSTKGKYHQNKKDTIGYIRKMGKKWGQESMGYEHEGDLTYIDST